MSNLVFMPAIMSEKLFSNNLGVQIESDVSSRVKWVPQNRVVEWAIRWKYVEVKKGSLSWPRLYDDNAAALVGYDQIIGIKCVPDWARLAAHDASPPDPKYYPELARFVQAVQDRYNPVGIEFFNEPDVIMTPEFPFGEFFGAWVMPGETFFQGGLRYGKAVRDVSKDLQARLFAGALSMHSNSLEFLRGMLDAARPYAITYHAYARSPDMFENARLYAERINQLTAYDIPLIITEASVTGSQDTEQLRQWQVDYLRHLRGLRGNVVCKLWYTINNGWENSDLVFNDEPKPVYKNWLQET